MTNDKEIAKLKAAQLECVCWLYEKRGDFGCAHCEALEAQIRKLLKNSKVLRGETHDQYN